MPDRLQWHCLERQASWIDSFDNSQITDLLKKICCLIWKLCSVTLFPCPVVVSVVTVPPPSADIISSCPQSWPPRTSVVRVSLAERKRERKRTKGHHCHVTVEHRAAPAPRTRMEARTSQGRSGKTFLFTDDEVTSKNVQVRWCRGGIGTREWGLLFIKLSFEASSYLHKGGEKGNRGFVHQSSLTIWGRWQFTQWAWDWCWGT